MSKFKRRTEKKYLVLICPLCGKDVIKTESFYCRCFLPRNFIPKSEILINGAYHMKSDGFSKGNVQMKKLYIQKLKESGFDINSPTLFKTAFRIPETFYSDSQKKEIRRELREERRRNRKKIKMAKAGIVSKSMADNFYRSWEWNKVRYVIIKKYGPVCMCCGSKKEIVVDHIKPLRKHWHLRLEPTNLQILCRSCNMGKSNDDETSFLPNPK